MSNVRHDRDAEIAWLLSASPLLAVCDSLLKGIALSAIALLVWGLTTVSVVLARRVLHAQAHLPSCALLIAAAVAAADLLLRITWFDMHLVLGAQALLLATNAALLSAAAEAATRRAMQPQAARQPPRHRPWLALCAGFAGTGVLRELMASGTILGDAGPLLGDEAAAATIHIADTGLLPIAGQPAGGFFVLALMAALWQLGHARGTSQ